MAFLLNPPPSFLYLFFFLSLFDTLNLQVHLTDRLLLIVVHGLFGNNFLWFFNNPLIDILQ